MIAVLGLFSSTPLAVIAQGATPETGETAEAEQTVVESTDAVTDETTGSTEQSGGDTTTEDGAVEPDTTTGTTAESSSAGTFETSSVETAETGDTQVDASPILPNTDWLEVASATDPVTLDPGGEQWYDFTHYVTTYRTGTNIHAELRHADGSIASGWGLSAQAGGGEWAGGDAVVDVSEWGTLVPDTAFTLSIGITAPAAVDAEQTVSLFVSSTASTERGETETGVQTGPLVTLAVVPPPIPNTDTLTATTSKEAVTLEPGGTQQYGFTYTVTTPRTGTSIVADLRLPDGSPATGWAITAQAGGGEAVSGDARVETGEWATLAPGPFTLTITVTAPADVATEQTMSLWIASTATTDLGVESAVAANGPLASLTVTPPPSEIVAEVAAEPVVVEEAPVTCDVAEDAAPWITTDLADYPPGALVTLTGGNWVAGQNIEILVEDDGIADAERGEWSHSATVTAAEQGGFTYQFDLAPWYVADYSVVATGECAEATTTFTDAAASATISPTSVPAGKTGQQFTITVSNNSDDSSTKLSSASITIPSGFTNVVASQPSISTWTAVVNTESGYISLSTTSNNLRLNKGDSVAVTFTANVPATTGDFTWMVDARANSDGTGTQFPINSQPRVTVTAAACPPTVSADDISFGTTTWDGTRYPPQQANLLLTITADTATCATSSDNWSIQISTQGMAGESNGEAIPPDAIAFVGGAETPAGLTEAAPVEFSSTLQPIANGDSEFAGSHTWNATLELTPPNDAMPDDYSGTITISIVNGQ